MLFYLLSAEELRGLLDRLGYRLEPAAIPRNVDYYLERTSHGSTLSGVVTPGCWPAATGRGPGGSLSRRSPATSTTPRAAPPPRASTWAPWPGTVDLAQRCYTGLETRQDVLWLNPSLPEELDGLDFEVRYRGHWGINLRLTPQLLRVRVAHSPRTAHGSSLSPAVHAARLARAGDPDRALELFRLACRLDLDDLTGTTAGGLHLATMGGVWQALASGFLGLRPSGRALGLDPHLPGAWDAVRLGLRYHGQRLIVQASHDRLQLLVDGSVPVKLPGLPARPVAPPGASWHRTGRTWKQEPR